MNLAPIDCFDGEFSFLPFAAQLRYGQVPTHPSSNDFQDAACIVSSDLDTYVEAHWHLEAVRERVLHPGRALDDAMRDINTRVARRLYDRSRANQIIAP